jgi:putative FmdB family regulatory protein
LPTYVYRCQQCGQVIERRQSFTDAPLTECESCQGQLQRVLQPVGIIFKGSGFYSTDYRPGGRSGNGADEKSKTSEDSFAKSESKTSSDPKTSTTSSTSSKPTDGSTSSSSGGSAPASAGSPGSSASK